MSKPEIYLNGDFVPADRLVISAEDLGFTMGATVTERLRTFGGRPFQLERHLCRMNRSLQILGIPADRVTAQIEQALTEYTKRYITPHSMSHPIQDDWYLVAFVTPGILGKNQPTVCVHGGLLPFETWAKQYEQGVPLVVSETRQIPSNCWPVTMKCRSRMHYYLADQAAATTEIKINADTQQANAPVNGQADTLKKADAQPNVPANIPSNARALLLDQEGFVGEASTANIILATQNNTLLTPRFEKVLPGITVQVLEELAKSIGLTFDYRDIPLEELMAAKEIYLASTSVCLLPVCSVGNQPIGSGKPGPIFHQLMQAFSEHVHCDILAQAKAFMNRPPL